MTPLPGWLLKPEPRDRRRRRFLRLQTYLWGIICRRFCRPCCKFRYRFWNYGEATAIVFGNRVFPEELSGLTGVISCLDPVQTGFNHKAAGYLCNPVIIPTSLDKINQSGGFLCAVRDTVIAHRWRLPPSLCLHRQKPDCFV